MASVADKDRTTSFNNLVSLLKSTPESIFDPFTITRTYYKSAGIQIAVDVLVPKTLPASAPQKQPRPVIVRIHGGFLVTGSSLFPGWFSKWILLYAQHHGAVIVSPNYRLLPEVKGVDILDDMREFWRWFDAGGPQSVVSDLMLDLEGYLLVGESAGGYLALQSILSNYTRPRALIALYPMLDLTSDFYTQASAKPIVGVSNFPNELIDTFLSSLETAPCKPPALTEADPPDRLDLALAMVQNGRLLDFLGDEPVLFPIERIVEGTWLPPMLVMHGREDSAVPVAGTGRFVERVRSVDPGCRMRVVVRPGDHGFDALATLEDGWLREGLEFVSAEWLGSIGLNTALVLDLAEKGFGKSIAVIAEYLPKGTLHPPAISGTDANIRRWDRLGHVHLPSQNCFRRWRRAVVS
ncbi:Alpha/Beta hydrolase protein [Aspergillus karnatakaensis]|uniref:alpha/beta hydrolase n=1 Tax=Aspergillus karnatakaensis TaxID=1810916 RepID=UPI003CCC9D54